MKRILYVHHVSSVGGASFCLLNIIKALDREKYEPVALLKSPGPLSAELEKINVEVAYLSSLAAIPYNKSLTSFRTWLGYARVFSSLRKFKSFIQSGDYDIVYFNNMMLYPYLRVSKGLKTIVHVREHWPLNEHKLQLRAAQYVMKNNVSWVVAISQYSARMFDECKERTTIVHDWISFEGRFNGPKLSELFKEDINGKRIYLFTGGLHWTKGTLEVVKAFSSCIKDDNSRLLVLGVNKRSNNHLGIKRFLRLGRNDYAQKVNELVSLDSRIKCVPSIYALGNVLRDSYCNLSFFTIPHANLTMAEGILLGTPSVAARTDESIEYSDSGKLAILFDFKDVTAFEKAILHLNENYYSIKTSIKNNRQLVEEMFKSYIDSKGW